MTGIVSSHLSRTSHANKVKFLADSNIFWLHCLAQAGYGLVNCANLMQNLLVIRFVGQNNMNNGFAIMQAFLGAASLVVPLTIDMMVGRFGVHFDALYYLGAGIVCTLSLFIMGITHAFY